VFLEKRALLLDMNSTFMFGEDSFGEAEDFSAYYFKIGGKRSRNEINAIVRAVYEYLDACYLDEKYRENFPAVRAAICQVAGDTLEQDEVERIVDTFAFHELGYIPDEYVKALHALRQHFRLAAVIDIWSPKAVWLKEFERAGIAGLFSAVSFSSDHGMVKPSPKPFELVLNQLGITAREALVVGDSIRRDLGGATKAGIDCILIGNAEHPNARETYGSLLELCKTINVEFKARLHDA
jgi:FMN phosphatase YigB (HAD superfamily)